MNKLIWDYIKDLIETQYVHTNISHLTQEITELWSDLVDNLAERLVHDIYNIDTCNLSALRNLWGKIFKLSDTYYNEDTKEFFTLTTEEYRQLLKLRAFNRRMTGTLGPMNEALPDIYNAQEGQFAYVKDNLNMSLNFYLVGFPLTENMVYVLEHSSIVPHPAGVGPIHPIVYDTLYFGFRVYGVEPPRHGITGFRTYDNPDKKGKWRRYPQGA